MIRCIATSILILSGLALQGQSKVIHVPADSSSIQSAIDGAFDGDTVLVADGLYYENINFNGKAITVASHYLIDGDTAHISHTVIDGSQASNPDSASVVLMVSGEDSTSVLYGLTITGGTGIHDFQNGFNFIGGAGVYGFNCGGKIESNIIRENYISAGSLLGYGPGILFAVSDDKNLIIRNNIISNNSGTSNNYFHWGGVCLIFWGGKGTALVEDNRIISNEIESVNNTAHGGGLGMVFQLPTSGYDVIVRNNYISDNVVKGKDANAGGMCIRYIDPGTPYNDPDPTPLVYNNIICNNSALHQAGGIKVKTWYNKPGNTVAPQPIFINNTIVDNTSLYGEGMYIENCQPVLINNIIRNDNSNDGKPDIEFANASANIYHSNIQGGTEGPGNIDMNPKFKPGTFELAEGSPCIGAGANSVEVDEAGYHAPSTDFYDNPRPNPIDQWVDIGAIESPFSWQNDDKTIEVPGERATIQQGIDAAVEGDTVLVAEGIYYENINFKGKAITVASHYLVDGDTAHISNTVIDGSQASDPDFASVVTFNTGEDTSSVIKGFTITGGAGTKYDIGTHGGYYGGGIHIASAATVENNIIEGNSLIQEMYQNNLFMAGAGINVHLGTARIRNNLIRNNYLKSARGVGGCGINIAGSDAVVENNVVTDNISESTFWGIGGGVSFFTPDGTGILRNNMITNNSLISDGASSNRVSGGGVFVQNALRMNIYNNIISDNITNGKGGGIGFMECSGPNSFINNTLSNNSSGYGGHSVFAELGSKMMLMNNILWVESGQSDNLLVHDNSELNTYHNCIAGGEDSVNIDSVPKFKPGSFDLSEDSPCIGAGANSVEVDEVWYYAPSTDFNGDPRPNPIDKWVDIGAIESTYDIINIEKRNAQAAPISIYPNPFSRNLTVEIAENLKVNRIELISLDGKTVKIFNQLQKKILIIERGNLPSGLYFLKVEAGETFVRKVVVE